jgi:hypothetical protein
MYRINERMIEKAKGIKSVYEWEAYLKADAVYKRLLKQLLSRSLCLLSS